MSVAANVQVRVFGPGEEAAAVAHAGTGGIALYLHSDVHPNSPPHFLEAMVDDQPVGRLYDMNTARLIATAVEVGVAPSAKQAVRVFHEGKPRQNLGLSGRPLLRLLAKVKSGLELGKALRSWPRYKA